MSIQILSIDKTLLPYKFDITLDNVLYSFDVRYNNNFDFFTIDLYRQNEILVFGEKISHNLPLFGAKVQKISDYFTIIPRNIKYPKLLLIATDLTEKEKTITYKNFGESIFLYARTEADLNV